MRATTGSGSARIAADEEVLDLGGDIGCVGGFFQLPHQETQPQSPGFATTFFLIGHPDHVGDERVDVGVSRQAP